MTVGLGGDFAANERGQPMQIYGSHRPFYPLDPDFAQIDSFGIFGIAHALSMLCRYGGHVRQFYSVAQHSVLVSELCPPQYRREGLLHDAAEAFIGDIVRPLKIQFPLYHVAEQRIEQAIAARWGLVYPWPAEVKHADNVALATEKRDVVHPSDADWGELPLADHGTIKPLGPADARAAFLARATILL